MSSIVVAAKPLLVNVSFAAASKCIRRASGAGRATSRSGDGLPLACLRLTDFLAMQNLSFS
ncbi:hypothetical protein [Bradyrhizobium iriomotense]|uniref:hypothetical protein n=1 Tax=Bradyrhizobium iriomotense TaxID=441950 RepID=UPI001B89E12F|nr:hypothetical protein [Bradyrhizobium iriomotense]MBR1132446.1 hypothetical protein [Bradyrhizobium iriomotense]